MIKTIKKIDLLGNETWQEVYVCNRCKRTLEEDEYVYTTKWKSYFPVQPKGLVACGFAQGSNPDIHICEKCSREVEDFWNGKDTKTTISSGMPKLTTFEERVNASLDYYREQSTTALIEHLHSYACARESAAAIKIVLNERDPYTARKENNK